MLSAEAVEGCFFVESRQLPMETFGSFPTPVHPRSAKVQQRAHRSQPKKTQDQPKSRTEKALQNTAVTASVKQTKAAKLAQRTVESVNQNAATEHATVKQKIALSAHKTASASQEPNATKQKAFKPASTIQSAAMGNATVKQKTVSTVPRTASVLVDKSAVRKNKAASNHIVEMVFADLLMVNGATTAK